MDTYVIKYGSAGLSFLIHQLTSSHAINFDYLDPITTVTKLGLIGYKNIGTKIGIHDHMLCIQEPSMFQCVQRYLNQDDRNQLYQLHFPIIYFHGLVLGHIHHDGYQPYQAFFKSLEDAIGFKRCGSLRSAQIWKVRAQSISNVMEKLTVEDLERGIVYRIGIDWPTGTSMAEIIIPVEKVDSNTLERAEGRY